MHTVTLNIPDNHFDTVMTIIKNLKENLITHYEVDPISDPYFEERKRHLQQTYHKIQSGEMPLHDFEDSMQELLAELNA